MAGSWYSMIVCSFRRRGKRVVLSEGNHQKPAAVVQVGRKSPMYLFYVK
jgi:hypothetical protein